MPPITGTTMLLGLIGDPVEHSLSPQMQNAALAELDLDYVYIPFPVTRRKFSPCDRDRWIRNVSTARCICFTNLARTIGVNKTLVSLVKMYKEEGADWRSPY